MISTTEKSPRRADLIVVGGGLADALGDRLLGPARVAVGAYAFRVPRRRVRIVPAALGGDVGLVGALPLFEQANLSDI